MKQNSVDLLKNIKSFKEREKNYALLIAIGFIKKIIL